MTQPSCTDQPAGPAAPPPAPDPARFSAKFAQLLLDGANLLARQRLAVQRRVEDKAKPVPAGEVESWVKSLRLLFQTSVEFQQQLVAQAARPADPASELTPAQRADLEVRVLPFLRAWEAAVENADMAGA
jgi:hypothetical protein